jgi:hypothetical protein
VQDRNHAACIRLPTGRAGLFGASSLPGLFGGKRTTEPFDRALPAALAHSIRVALIVATAACIPSCAALPRLDPVPESLTEQAVIPGISGCRHWLDRDLGPFIQMVVQDLARQRAARARAGQPTDPMPPVTVLSVSGGGDNGAFAAGILSGWSGHGDRPEFTVVTGVSAGALIAPFAFLGPAYDDVLREAATSIGPDDVFRERSRVSGLLSDGMASSEPLRRLVERYVTPEVVAAVAREYRKGRTLQIATTDLDAGRQVAWNMGVIAASDAPGALELFRKIMIASTSIPGAVSPVMIDVEAAGKHYQEMHVDGGVITQVFTYPSHTLAALEKATGSPLRRAITVFVIRNGRLEPDWADTPRRTLSIAGRAINALVQSEGVNDIYRAYHTARQDEAHFNLAYIAADFNAPHRKAFEMAYMQSLFEYGYRLGAAGSAWHSAPPGEVTPGVPLSK